MNYQVNTVIIGGGPAGMSCGITLQKNGASVLVIEKKTFPRDKTCGGLMTQKTYDLLHEKLQIDSKVLDEMICESTNAIAMYHRQTALVEARVSTPFRLIKRAEFDSFLADIYRACGGKLLENSYAKKIDAAKKQIILNSGDTVSYRHLIIADGALSSTKKLLDYPQAKVGFCVETHIPKSALTMQPEVRIIFGLVKTGYAWIFPSGETWCIGLGGTDEKNIRYDNLLKELLQSLQIDETACTFKGAFVPYGYSAGAFCTKNDILTAGDAAGFVDPIYGEGLYFSLLSGMEAAASVLSAADPGKEYLKRTQPIIKRIRQGMVLQKIFFSPNAMKRFIKIIRGRSGFFGYYCEHLISQYDYEYFKLAKLCRDYKKNKKK